MEHVARRGTIVSAFTGTPRFCSSISPNPGMSSAGPESNTNGDRGSALLRPVVVKAVAHFARRSRARRPRARGARRRGLPGPMAQVLAPGRRAAGFPARPAVQARVSAGAPAGSSTSHCSARAWPKPTWGTGDARRRPPRRNLGASAGALRLCCQPVSRLDAGVVGAAAMPPAWPSPPSTTVSVGRSWRAGPRDGARVPVADFRDVRRLSCGIRAKDMRPACWSSSTGGCSDLGGAASARCASGAPPRAMRAVGVSPPSEERFTWRSSSRAWSIGTARRSATSPAIASSPRPSTRVNRQFVPRRSPCW